ncbi:Hypothetical protein R9X50_00556300 [Acrodontium crateriforme]|uniref:Uncharacterized protein n=1 Tax=Acrodontium crateriforme TaxID=150365 RepID=A0AAQ3M6D8_9PEZI|nr:Hypothetical protein R9X50_00556300 [Acrodontium crateriforme]
MSHKVHDHWFWLGFGVVLFLAARGIRACMTELVQDTEIDNPADPTEEDQNTEPEDSISLETLKTLSTSTNQNIANAAISIIVNRYLKQPNAQENLVQESKSPDENVQKRAKLIIRFLKHWPIPTGFDHPVAGDGTWTPYTESHIGEDFFTPLSIPETFEFDESITGWTDIPRERPVSLDLGETERRRRRREAMVLRESDGQVQEEDIIRLH